MQILIGKIGYMPCYADGIPVESLREMSQMQRNAFRNFAERMITEVKLMVVRDGLAYELPYEDYEVREGSIYFTARQVVLLPGFEYSLLVYGQLIAMHGHVSSKVNFDYPTTG